MGFHQWTLKNQPITRLLVGRCSACGFMNMRDEKPQPHPALLQDSPWLLAWPRAILGRDVSARPRADLSARHPRPHPHPHHTLPPIRAVLRAVGSWPMADQMLPDQFSCGWPAIEEVAWLCPSASAVEIQWQGYSHDLTKCQARTGVLRSLWQHPADFNKGGLKRIEITLEQWQPT